MQVFTAGTTRKTETGIYHLPQKNLTSLGEGKRTLNAVDRRGIENRQMRAV
jgi:hypothetical protein